MNTADAINSCSPWKLWMRFVVSSQISTGMLKIRVSVMELGRFTLLEAPVARDSPRLCSTNTGNAMRRKRESSCWSKIPVARPQPVRYQAFVPVLLNDDKRLSPICRRFECSGSEPFGDSLSIMLGSN